MASKGINKVIIVGNLGNDPDTRSFPDGSMVSNASIATSESWTDKQGQKQERTEWHRVVFKDRGAYKMGEWAGQYLKKGSKVYVEGKLQTRKWQDKQGVDHYTTEIIANEMQMMDRAGDNQARPAPAPAPRPAPAAAPPPQEDFYADDIPF